jgi:hypothetical protein
VASEIDDAGWDRSISVNLNGTVHRLDETGPGEGGRLVNVRRYLTSAAGPAIPAAAVADALVAGVRRNRAVITPGRARLLHVAARCSPAVTERVLTHFMRRELARSS